MFPQVLVQPAAYGLPAVAMENFHPDSVVNGEAGYLVKSESELACKLGLLPSDHGLRQKMSTASARHASPFDWDKVHRTGRRYLWR